MPDTLLSNGNRNLSRSLQPSVENVLIINIVKGQAQGMKSTTIKVENYREWARKIKISVGTMGKLKKEQFY